MNPTTTKELRDALAGLLVDGEGMEFDPQGIPHPNKAAAIAHSRAKVALEAFDSAPTWSPISEAPKGVPVLTDQGVGVYLDSGEGIASRPGWYECNLAGVCIWVEHEEGYWSRLFPTLFLPIPPLP